MPQCNHTKNDECTFFILNVDLVVVRNWVLHAVHKCEIGWVLQYINENAKRLAESILMLYIFTSRCPLGEGEGGGGGSNGL